METYHGGRNRRPAGRVVRTVGIATALWAIGWAAWVRARPFRALVDGDSMEPALRAGDVVVATARGSVRSGIIVVVEHPNRPGFELIKRVTAGPGDLTPRGDIVGSDEYWVEGDRPERSTDSRAFGPVGRGAIRGVVRFRLPMWSV